MGGEVQRWYSCRGGGRGSDKDLAVNVIIEIPTTSPIHIWRSRIQFKHELNPPRSVRGSQFVELIAILTLVFHIAIAIEIEIAVE